ncbi:hypothetical protein Bca52824_003945 [Brassica carinata]|uniref:Uncharacterized protein n=1 Tax=Brassica carinata TaxID=52824 RepID=A0A8X7WP48_BRACI|nr:hypothetical protein Bca52824_043340 [Brassica carinata]KAG2332765.1 hypothetical protein Bca52824_003945 [Brassica carinata]
MKSLVELEYITLHPFDSGLVFLINVISPSVFAKNQCCTTSIIKGGMSGRENLSTAEEVNSSEKNDSGLVMHPLLFWTPEHGQVTTSSTKGFSCSSTFLSGTGKNAKLCELEDASGAVDKGCIAASGRNDGSQVAGSNATSRCIDEMGDQSNQGIVMEHEELSDSDQEMMEEQHVEFECEEMTDSQGEDDSECDGNSR